MERHIRTLAVLLVVQLLVVAGIWFFGASTSGPAADLVSFDRASITAVEIDDRTDTVRLERTDGRWRIPAADGLPADGSKLDELLDKLAAAKAAWPVATTTSAAERFEVAVENYQRRIRLFAGDQVVFDLKLGTSPGFRKVHARLENSTDVFAITFANYEAPTKQDEWLDKALLQPNGEITRLTRTGAYTLERVDDAWSMLDASDDETLNQDAARDLVAKLANLRVLGRAETPPAADALPRAEFEVTTESGTISLRFYREGDEGDFVVSGARDAPYFRVAAYTGEGVTIDRAALLVAAHGPDSTPTPQSIDAMSDPS